MSQGQNQSGIPMKTQQQFLTVSAGKRLIAKAVLALPEMVAAWENGTIVVMAGSTNGYVVEECLRKAGVDLPFDRTSFVRGVTTAPGRKIPERAGAYGTASGNDPNQPGSPSKPVFPGDLVIERGAPRFGQTIFDVAAGLKAGDVVLKGANAVQLSRRQAGILIGHPEMGTIGPILQAVLGRRVSLVVPAGLEKRVEEDINDLARLMNSPETAGVRLMPVMGEIVTELEAISLLTGATARLVSAGGVCGAEGGTWLALTGTTEQLAAAGALLRGLTREPAWDAMPLDDASPLL